MWFALGIPLMVMVVAVLLERFEQRYVPPDSTPEHAESTVDFGGQGRV